MKKWIFPVAAITVLTLSACSSIPHSATSSASSAIADSSSVVSKVISSDVSSAVSSDNEDYSTFTGSWSINGISDITADGGIGLTITIDSSNNASGTMTVCTPNAGRIDTADFSGAIKNGALSVSYEDSFGNQGAFHFEFQEEKIIEYSEPTGAITGLSFNQSPITLLKTSDTVSNK